MTADYVAFHAAERPDATAFVDHGRVITFSQFARDIRRCMQAVSDLGARRGNWVGVGCADIYLHWILLLALQRLGIASTSLQRDEPSGASRLFQRLDLVISGWDFPQFPIKRRHAITPQWVAAVREGAEIDERALPPKSRDDVVRVGHTAGTTGAPKMMPSERWNEDGRADSFIWSFEITNRARFLITTPFNVGSIFPLTSAVVRAGGTLVLETRMPIAQALSAHGITHLAAFPAHLKFILDSLPADFAKPAELSIFAFGATLSETLRERTMTRLATRLSDCYGSREAGFVSRIMSSGSGGIGTIWPDVEVEAVDEAGAPVPMGQLGRLKMRAPFMHSEYLDDPEATRRFFRDGWLLSGDIGVLHGPRRLQIVGRYDEIMNVGGNKLPPGNIEDMVLRTVNARDAGVVAMPGRDGIEEIWIAVADAQGDDRTLWARIGAALRTLQFTTFHLVRLPEIPRNAGGKILREQLKRAIAEAREVSRG